MLEETVYRDQHICFITIVIDYSKHLIGGIVGRVVLYCILGKVMYILYYIYSGWCNGSADRLSFLHIKRHSTGWRI